MAQEVWVAPGPDMADNAKMLALHVITVLVSAGLLFLVQPMFARMVLPMLGGSPSVWNTALVFYQMTLLAGYAYAHLLTRWLTVRRQAIVHVCIVVAAFLCLPIALPHGWSPPTDHSPVAWMLALLAVGIGLPFFVVSTTGPLIQKWFAASGHTGARDPYFLYAASNVGSMLGLLGYPLLIEPRLRLSEQSTLWTVGYAALALLIAGCGVWLARSARTAAAAASEARPYVIDIADHSPSARAPITMPRRWRWVILAFIPSSLMIGVTTHITTDVAAIPLLWVLPLALYLLSFILVFASRPPLSHKAMVRALPMSVLALVIVMEARAAEPVRLIIALHLLQMFIAAMVCHGELAKDRPSPRHLTEFYLWLAVGGALGGVFNALVAPLAFKSIAEYPIAIVLACLAMPPRGTLKLDDRSRLLDVVVPVLMGGVVVGFYAACSIFKLPMSGVAIALLFSALALPLYALAGRPLRFGLALAAVLLADPGTLMQRSRLLHQERSFFGVHRVMLTPDGKFHDLIHGSTLHGSQQVRPPRCDEALGYYHRTGPAGDVFNELPLRAGRSVAIAGLGTGALAAYAREGERWTMFEIDPIVERIASDTSYFCYLAASHAPHHIVLGDARRSITATDERFDLMVFDAYTSDAIPVHLLTREALAAYCEKLNPGGVMVFHLSNRYFDLVPVVAELASDAHLPCRVRAMMDVPEEMADSLRIANSVYAVIARSEADFGTLASDPRWVTPKPRVNLRLWTDDYSSLLSVLR